MISETIELLQKEPYYGVGIYVEIAKGEHQAIWTWRRFREKITRKKLSK